MVEVLMIVCAIVFVVWGDFNSAFFQVEGVQVGGCTLNSILRFYVIFVIWKGF